MFLQLRHIQKSYGGKAVLVDVDLALAQHKTLSILGRSGCGKSTLLKIIAGIEPADNGTVALQNKDITTVPPQRRNIVYLFQEPLLFPHLSVFENVAFGLRIRKERVVDIKKKVTEMLDSLAIADQQQKMPHQLSGGQKQRVAFGRALIIQPPLLLLDEPFSSLDVETRGDMQQLFKRIASDFGVTALFVTHDLKEALIMGDEISYMEDGKLQLYPSKEAFVADDKTGVRNEVAFWKGL